MLARCAPNQISQGFVYSATARNTHPCVCSLSRTSLCARCLTLRNLIRITFSLTRQTLCACDILWTTCLRHLTSTTPPKSRFVRHGGLHEKVSEHFMRDLDSLGICRNISKDLPGWQIQVPCAMDGALELIAYGRNNLAQMLREAMSRNM